MVRIFAAIVARINAALATARAEAGSRKPAVYRDKPALSTGSGRWPAASCCARCG